MWNQSKSFFLVTNRKQNNKETQYSYEKKLEPGIQIQIQKALFVPGGQFSSLHRACQDNK